MRHWQAKLLALSRVTQDPGVSFVTQTRFVARRIDELLIEVCLCEVLSGLALEPLPLCLPASSALRCGYRVDALQQIRAVRE
jgi:hypothetical protein